MLRSRSAATIQRESLAALLTRTGAVYAITAPPANMDERGQFLDILATVGEAA